MHRNSRLVVYIVYGVLGVALLAGLGVGIAALCGAFKQKIPEIPIPNSERALTSILAPSTTTQTTKVTDTTTDQITTDQITTDETKIDETKTDETKIDETKIDETKIDEIKTDETTKITTTTTTTTTAEITTAELTTTTTTTTPSTTTKRINKELCGRMDIDSKEHMFYVSAERDVFMSLVSSGEPVDGWSRENGSSFKFKSSTGLIAEVSEDKVLVAGKPVTEVFENCNNIIEDIKAARLIQGMHDLGTELHDAFVWRVDLVGSVLPKCGTYSEGGKEHVFWSFAKLTRVYEHKVGSKNGFDFYRSTESAVVPMTVSSQVCDVSLLDKLVNRKEIKVTCEGSAVSSFTSFYNPEHSLLLTEAGGTFRMADNMCQSTEASYGRWEAEGNTTYFHVSALAKNSPQVVTAVRVGSSSAGVATQLTTSSDLSQNPIKTLIDANGTHENLQKLTLDAWELSLFNDIQSVAKSLCTPKKVSIISDLDNLQSVLSANSKSSFKALNEFKCPNECASLMTADNRRFRMWRSADDFRVMEQLSNATFFRPAEVMQIDDLTVIDNHLNVNLASGHFTTVQEGQNTVIPDKAENCPLLYEWIESITTRQDAIKQKKITCGDKALAGTEFALHYADPQVQVDGKLYNVDLENSTCTLASQ